MDMTTQGRKGRRTEELQRLGRACLVAPMLGMWLSARVLEEIGIPAIAPYERRCGRLRWAIRTGSVVTRR